jgi:6-phosphofructokinase 1
VVRELVFCLEKQYGVGTVWGVPGGYRGFLTPAQWRPLSAAVVDQWHTLGGTALGTSRGGHDTAGIVDALAAKGVTQLFVVGGDGTLRGASLVAREAQKRGLALSVVGVPKTVDNDIPIIDKSFGFETAVEEAQRAIDSVNVEARSFPFGVGVVQLMGRK